MSPTGVRRPDSRARPTRGPRSVTSSRRHVSIKQRINASGLRDPGPEKGTTMQTEKRSQKIAVTGATGRVGSHLVEILEQRGHDVVLIARSEGVDVISGDGLDEALIGA